jgi:hypothetical protein
VKSQHAIKDIQHGKSITKKIPITCYGQYGQAAAKTKGKSTRLERHQKNK